MREIAITVAAADAEAVIERLLSIAPYGVLEDPHDGLVALRVRAPARELPPAAEVARRVAAAVSEGTRPVLEECEVPDAWPARRLLDYRPHIVDGVCIRPLWAPVTEGVIDVAIDESDAFGSGLHPTTRDCIALLRYAERRGPLADLGCGSGVLSILAAKLGFGPVTAVDVSEIAVAAARRNAAHNGVEIDVGQVDLLADRAPFAPVIVANMPAAVHATVVAAFPEPPELVIASGILVGEFEGVAGRYAEAGLGLGRYHEEAGWVACEFLGSV